MADIQAYVIRHKPTGHYLPMGAKQNGRGGTLREPERVELGNLPRFFHSQANANRALQCWMRGKYGSDREEYGTYWDGTVTPVKSRKFEEMEIIPITLQFP